MATAAFVAPLNVRLIPSNRPVTRNAVRGRPSNRMTPTMMLPIPAAVMPAPERRSRNWQRMRCPFSDLEADNPELRDIATRCARDVGDFIRIMTRLTPINAEMPAGVDD
jgi:hypothetical protein